MCTFRPAINRNFCNSDVSNRYVSKCHVCNRHVYNCHIYIVLLGPLLSNTFSCKSWKKSRPTPNHGILNISYRRRCAFSYFTKRSISKNPGPYRCKHSRHHTSLQISQAHAIEPTSSDLLVAHLHKLLVVTSSHNSVYGSPWVATLH